MNEDIIITNFQLKVLKNITDELYKVLDDIIFEKYLPWVIQKIMI